MQVSAPCACLVAMEAKVGKPNPLEMELQMTVSCHTMLGLKSVSLGRASSALSH